VRLYDLGLELSALIAHRWGTFDGDRQGTRMGWAFLLAAGLIAEATARSVVPTGERRRGGDPQAVILSSEDLERLSDLSRRLPRLDEDAGEVLAAMERGAPSPEKLSELRPSALVRRCGSDVRRDA